MSTYNSIAEAIDDFKAGKMLIVVDDEDRENEGDFILSSQMITPEKINFLTKYARGMICISISQKRAKELELDLMVSENTVKTHLGLFVSPV